MLIETKPCNGGTQRVHRFGNGYGASVVRYENEGPDWRITYDTPITSDVEGWLDDGRVVELLRQIEDLPPHLVSA